MTLSTIVYWARYVAHKMLEVFLVFAPLVMLVWIFCLMTEAGRSLPSAAGLIVTLCLYMAASRIGVPRKAVDRNDSFWLRVKKSIFSYGYVEAHQKNSVDDMR